jgi:class 3 adenylate cyclase
MRFCGNCGQALAMAPVARREERKVVTVVFADLVGFTSRSETSDVEDVRAVLTPYHATLRAILERFGGTVEKFIGDAVMAVFGAPVAHEDDAERAVRAALAVRDELGHLPGELHVRIGVSSGEALVAVDARPELGEGMVSGDVVNTGARLQAAAPVDGVLVSEATYRATDRAIVYEAHPAVDAKGKALPVPCWVAVAPRALVPTADEDTVPLVGRTRERDALIAALERSRAERSTQLVTIVGVPGIGKSRLVRELRGVIEAEPALTTWREGAVRAYGEGVALRALAEMVQQECAILDSDDAATAEAKIAAGVDAVGLGGADAAWTRRQLGALLGVSGGGESGGEHEAFSGWRLFLEAIADGGSTVLVFEDLQWADPVLLDFIDHLVDRTRDVPLLVVCTTRPELLEQRPAWGGGKTNALTLLLQPLVDEEVEALIDHLIDPTLLTTDAREQLLERTAGNALFAQEYVRALVDAGATGAAALPDTIQGIIAARLDGLSREEKSLLQDAAVIGDPSWDGALHVLGGRDMASTDALIDRLDRKQLLRRQRRSTIAGENQLRFAHSLIRDVAYGQLTRPERARRHLAAADWIASRAERSDTAELIAHHLVTALEIDRQLEVPDRQLAARTGAALLAATRQAAARNDHAAAMAHATAALELVPTDDARAELLALRAAAGYHRGERSMEAFVEARDACLAVGRVEDAVRVSIMRGTAILRGSGPTPEHAGVVHDTLELAATLPPSPVVAEAIAAQSFLLDITGRTAEAIEMLGPHIAAADAADEEMAAAFLHSQRGTARISAGDLDGLEELRSSYAVLNRLGHPRAGSRGQNIGLALLATGYPRGARTMLLEAAAWARRVGSTMDEGAVTCLLAETEWVLGDADEALRLADAVVSGGVDQVDIMEAATLRAFALLDQAPAAGLQTAEEGVARYADADWFELLISVQALRVCALDRLGDQGVQTALDDLVEVWHRAPATLSGFFLATAADAFARHNRHDDLGRVLDTIPDSPLRSAVRLLAEARYAEAADAFADIPMVPMRNRARLLAASPSLPGS